MKVVVANGNHEADYIIKMFNKRSNTLVVINKDRDMCDYLSLENRLDAIFGDATQKFVLELANIKNFDVFVALSTNDVENYVACTMAKKMFGVKKCVTTVINPKNVDLFKRLGIDSVVCSSYLIGETIKTESMVDTLANSLSIMDSKIEMIEIEIEADNFVVGKMIKDLHFPSKSQICCIYRESSVLIPNGMTQIKDGDKMAIICTPEEKDKLLELLMRKS